MVKTVRWLKGSEDIGRINNFLAENQRGWTPIRDNALILASFDDKGLAGFSALQTIPHAEPLWVRPDLRNTGLAKELADEMVKFIKNSDVGGFMAIAETPEVVKLCEAFGMKRVEHPVYVL